MLRFVFSLVVVSLIFNVAVAQENKRRFTVNDLSAVDADYYIQGEYSGTSLNEQGYLQKTGLQVVAQGDGEFIAVRYAGGLPGSGWDRQNKDKFAGGSEGESTTLTGDAGSIVVQSGLASVYDSSGNLQGTLQRVTRESPRMGAVPPPGGVSLFNGTSTVAFKKGKMSDEGLLQVGTELLSLYRDFTLHVEFRLPYMPYARGQGRSNSGVYLLSRYEVQVLDSFGLDGVKNECGALYRQRAPDVNMCLPPLTWQTYDITFRSPRFDCFDNKIENARITVLHNGVAVQDDVEVISKTGAGKKEGRELFPTKFQDHSNPVQYRNIWIVDLSAENCQACR